MALNVAIIYIFPQVQIKTYYPLAHRFASTWRQFPPGREPYTLHVIGNGGDIPPIHQAAFNGIANCEFRFYNNVGWDIGAFQWAAETIPCDLLICLGAPVHFHRTGWLDRMVDAFLSNGPALYGCWAYLAPNWHVRTTCFWCPPQVIQSYPYAVSSAQKSRYDFEHGAHSITRHAISAGLECLMVTTDGVFPFSEWLDRAPDVEHSLVLDQFTHR